MPTERHDGTHASALSHDVAHWVNAAKFAVYAGMHAAANEYLNKASLIASINGVDEIAPEIGRLVDELKARLAGAHRSTPARHRWCPAMVTA
jgi:hypothetical protein